MNITIDQLIAAIKDSTVTATMLVQCQDYYSRRGDTTEVTIDYVNPHKLIEKLQELNND